MQPLLASTRERSQCGYNSHLLVTYKGPEEAEQEEVQVQFVVAEEQRNRHHHKPRATTTTTTTTTSGAQRFEIYSIFRRLQRVGNLVVVHSKPTHEKGNHGKKLRKKCKVGGEVPGNSAVVHCKTSVDRSNVVGDTIESETSATFCTV